jgi:hypothetical protein
MKKLLSFLLAIATCKIVHAQTDTTTAPATKEPEKLQTLFSNTGKLGWWVSPDFAWTQIENKDAFMVGISGGIIIKHSFSFGLAGYGIVNTHNLMYSNKNDTADVYLYGGYGGFKMEYRLNPLKMLNIAFPLLIGGGGVSYSTWDPYDWHSNNQDSQSYTWDSYFVLEPGVVVGINLLKFMRLDIGASYRYAPGVELPRTDNDLLTGFNFVSSLKFGRF